MRPRVVARIGWSRPVAALPAAGWDDIRNPALRQKQGQNDKPDFDFTNLGMLFPQNDATDWYDMILYRDDNLVSGDVLMKGFDWHAQFDALGSRGEYSK